jgi:hypothetical protein
MPVGQLVQRWPNGLRVGLNQMRRELGYAAQSAEIPLVGDGVVSGGPKVRITD